MTDSCSHPHGRILTYTPERIEHCYHCNALLIGDPHSARRVEYPPGYVIEALTGAANLNLQRLRNG